MVIFDNFKPFKIDGFRTNGKRTLLGRLEKRTEIGVSEVFISHVNDSLPRYPVRKLVFTGLEMNRNLVLQASNWIQIQLIFYNGSPLGPDFCSSILLVFK